MQLARNVGRNDKNIRIGAGIALLLVGFFGAGFLISLIGIVLIASVRSSLAAAVSAGVAVLLPRNE